MQYKHLLGKKFELGKQDCLTLIFDFYKHNYGIEIKNYARPDNYWGNGLDLLTQFVQNEGFVYIDENPHNWQTGDVFMMALGAEFPTHCAVYIGNNKIIHHLPDRASTEEQYRGAYRNYTVARVRHKSQFGRKEEYGKINLLDDPRLARLRNKL